MKLLALASSIMSAWAAKDGRMRAGMTGSMGRLDIVCNMTVLMLEWLTD